MPPASCPPATEGAVCPTCNRPTRTQVLNLIRVGRETHRTRRCRECRTKFVEVAVVARLVGKKI